MNAESILDRVKQACEVDERFSAAIAFGSQVRGIARADSDMDLAVLLSNTCPSDANYLYAMGELGMAAQTDVHLVELSGASLELQRSVFGHGVVLFDRSEGKLDSLRRQSAIAYVDAEYHRRIIDASIARRLEQSLG